MRFEDLLSGFSAGYWLLALHCMTVYGAIFPFNNISAALLRAQYVPSCGISDAAAIGYIQGIPYSLAAVATPLVGILVDKHGRRTAWMLGSALLLMAAHLLVAYHDSLPWPPTEHCVGFMDWGPSGPAVPFLLVGVAYSVVAGVVWPSVMCVVDPARKGTAFGLLNSLQNVTIAIVPLGVAAQLDLYGSDNYQPPEQLMAALAAGAAMLAALLWRWDASPDHGQDALWHVTRALPVRLATPVLPRRTPSSSSSSSRHQRKGGGRGGGAAALDERTRLLEMGSGGSGGGGHSMTRNEYPQKSKSLIY